MEEEESVENMGRLTYNRVRGILLLAHNPWDTSVKTYSHLCCPFGISFTRGTNFPFHRSKFILYLSKFNNEMIY